MTQPYSAQPNPEVSLQWSDEFWPPKSWYDLTSRAVEVIENQWFWGDPKTAKTLIPKMTEEQHLMWAVDNIVGQICNGGFSQALYNSYGELAEEAILGLRKFGMTRHAEIIDEAWTIFGIRPVPWSREVRIDRLEAMSDAEENNAPEPPSMIEHAFSLFRGTSKNWDDLETEFYGLLHAKTHGEGYNAAYFRPLAEWIYENRDRFFTS